MAEKHQAVAIDEGDKPKPKVNWHNFMVCFGICLGQIAFGYSASIIGVTLAQPAFLLYMGLVDATTGALTPNANNLIGATSGVFQVRLFLSPVMALLIYDTSRPVPSVEFSSTAGLWTSMVEKQESSSAPYHQSSAVLSFVQLQTSASSLLSVSLLVQAVGDSSP